MRALHRVLVPPANPSSHLRTILFAPSPENEVRLQTRMPENFVLMPFFVSRHIFQSRWLPYVLTVRAASTFIRLSMNGERMREFHLRRLI